MSLFKPVLRIVVLVLVGIELIGCFCINSIMFHPVRQYDAGHPGYVDIGTNGVKIAAIIPFAQGKELFGLAPEPKKFIPVEGADHNDLIDVLGLDEYRRLLTSMNTADAL